MFVVYNQSGPKDTNPALKFSLGSIETIDILGSTATLRIAVCGYKRENNIATEVGRVYKCVETKGSDKAGQFVWRKVESVAPAQNYQKVVTVITSECVSWANHFDELFQRGQGNRRAGSGIFLKKCVVGDCFPTYVKGAKICAPCSDRSGTDVLLETYGCTTTVCKVCRLCSIREGKTILKSILGCRAGGCKFKNKEHDAEDEKEKEEESEESEETEEEETEDHEEEKVQKDKTCAVDERETGLEYSIGDCVAMRMLNEQQEEVVYVGRIFGVTDTGEFEVNFYDPRTVRGKQDFAACWHRNERMGQVNVHPNTILAKVVWGQCQIHTRQCGVMGKEQWSRLEAMHAAELEKEALGNDAV
jgi:hypothetical protein